MQLWLFVGRHIGFLSRTVRQSYSSTRVSRQRAYLAPQKWSGNKESDIQKQKDTELGYYVFLSLVLTGVIVVF